MSVSLIRHVSVPRVSYRMFWLEGVREVFGDVSQCAKGAEIDKLGARHGVYHRQWLYAKEDKRA